MTTCLVTYDITSPKRLRRMHRALRRLAVPIQYSVFLGDFTAAGRAGLRALIEDIIDPAEDDVRIYPLPANCWQRRLGRASLPSGLTVTLLPREFRAAAGEPSPVAAEASSPTTAAKGRSAGGRSIRLVQRCARTGLQGGIRLIR